MANVKTAISLQETLFQQVEALAREMNISRSHLFALAMEEFMRNRESRLMLERINAAYDDTSDEAEQKLRRGIRPIHRQVVEGEW
jgi:metal-responsive CopG/Arc/MetJ family transcriptional regulator